MAANTKGLAKHQIWKDGPVVAFKIKAGATIPIGTLAMHVAGVAQPAASGVAGSVMLGVAEQTYRNDDPANDAAFADHDPMVFLRGDFAQLTTDGSVVDADIGTAVGVLDNQTMKSAVGTNDLSVVYRGRDTRGRHVFRVGDSVAQP